jgi:hypothetical protein
MEERTSLTPDSAGRLEGNRLFRELAQKETPAARSAAGALPMEEN